VTHDWPRSDSQAVDHREQLVQISYEASQEAALEGLLDRVAGK
jgi:hypothetical protein